MKLVKSINSKTKKYIPVEFGGILQFNYPIFYLENVNFFKLILHLLC